ncbi:hypothetical protein CDAR_592021 [Caerostris darwini]|uniref:Uncharacterized protein n=1 Tax=Caerostris darwini TaxID=1538125 RepID=A0AAV4MKL5_9ARAC|nr:hypothetical protein CDAR_592021 [Caerostris darwini]
MLHWISIIITFRVNLCGKIPWIELNHGFVTYDGIGSCLQRSDIVILVSENANFNLSCVNMISCIYSTRPSTGYLLLTIPSQFVRQNSMDRAHTPALDRRLLVVGLKRIEASDD